MHFLCSILTGLHVYFLEIERGNGHRQRFDTSNLEPRISNLESRISNLESRISNLEPRISNLESIVKCVLVLLLVLVPWAIHCMLYHVFYDVFSAACHVLCFALVTRSMGSLLYTCSYICAMDFIIALYYIHVTICIVSRLKTGYLYLRLTMHTPSLHFPYVS